MIVRGTWWASAAQPIILGFGAAFAANEIEFEPHLMPFTRLRFPKSWKEFKDVCKKIKETNFVTEEEEQ